MQEEYRLLVDEQLICGMQVHVGVADRDLAVEITQRVSRDLPLLLALSASSPFWHGRDTGYASIRTIIWQRWPTAGTTGPLASAAEYDDLVADLIASGVIADAKMAYFDVRPSSHVPDPRAAGLRRLPAGRRRRPDRRPVPRRWSPTAEDDIADGEPIAPSAPPAAPRGDVAGRPQRADRRPARRQRRIRSRSRPRTRSAPCCTGSVRSWRSSATGTSSAS